LSGRDELQAITFSLGREMYGIEVRQIKEIIKVREYVRVPRAPDFVEGVINLRGQITPILNLRKIFGIEQRPVNEDSRIIMVEMDREKCKYLRLNFSKLGVDFQVICSDARKVDYSGLNADVVSVSPPCEDLTVLKYFNYNPTNRGTIPLTLFAIRFVDALRPKVALYENVYRVALKQILEEHGWKAIRFNMSRLIPQKRVRLIAVKRL